MGSKLFLEFEDLFLGNGSNRTWAASADGMSFEKARATFETLTHRNRNNVNGTINQLK